MRRTSSTAASSGLAQTTWSMRCVSRSSWPTLRRSSPEKYERTRLRRFAGLADVEHAAARRRGTGTRPGARGSWSVSRSLAAWGGRRCVGSASRSSSPSTPRPAARSSSRCSRSPVARASSRARWVGGGGRGGGASASVPSRQFGTSSRTSRRARAHVSTERLARRRPLGAVERGVEEAEVEADVVADDHRVARRTRATVGQHRPRCGARAAPWPAVMPVSTVICGRDGRARVHQGLEGAEALAAAQLHRADLGDAAVGRRAAGGLEVDHAERDLAQRRAEVVEAARCIAGTVERTGVRCATSVRCDDERAIGACAVSAMRAAR